MIYLIAILVYLMILIGVGAIRSGGVRTQDDFMVAGRSLTTPILVGTLIATWIGTGSIFGSAGLGYEYGIPGVWFSVGAWLGMILLLFIAGRARALDQYTVPDIFELRYNNLARLLGSIVIMVAYTGIVSYQLVAGGEVLHIITGIEPGVGVIITGLFVITYTALAGMFSVAYTDVANGLMILVGLAVAFPFIWNHAGGTDGISMALDPAHFSVFGELNVIEALGLSLPTLFLLLGESNMYQRFFSAKDSKTAQNATLWWIIGVVLVESLILGFAIVASAAFPDLAQPDHIIIIAAREGVPILVGCVMLAVIVAVIVSTADSFLLVPSTNMMRDIYQTFINRDATQRQMVRYSRYVVIGLGVIAYLQTLPGESIIDMILRAYTMYGAAITPALMGAFFFRAGTTAGGVASIAGGMGMTLIWEIWNLKEVEFALPLVGATNIATIYPSLIISILALILFSYFTGPPAEEKVARFRKHKPVSGA
ncbi:MAG TPA: sodium:solute symporter family protein [bacterium]|nr:sodium:solute symporter family protein [bacterium]